MNKYKLSAIAFCLTTALSACNDGSGFTSNLEAETTVDTVTGSTALRGIVADNGTEIVAIDGVDIPGAEGVENLIDGTSATKFLTFADTAQVIIKTPKAYTIVGYEITSANDAPERDPTDWILEGSNDGTTWESVDTQAGQSFTTFFTTNKYEIPAGGAEYTQFRFTLEHAAGVGILQLSEIELIVKAEAPLTDFSSTVMAPEINEIVIFNDDSLVNPTSWLWTFEGGTPTTSNEKNPLVRFDSLGAKTVTLVATNDKGSTELVKKDMIRVWDPTQPWLGFPKPIVSFTKNIPDHAGQIALERVMPDLEDVIHEISLGVAKILFNNVTEINIFETLNFETGSYDFPAAKSGTDKDMLLQFDLDHLARTAENGDEALKNEVLGVLWHELTHGYNNSPNSGNYITGDEYHTYLEALANYSRIKAGYHENRRADIEWVKDWNVDAYEQTSFFFEWVQNGNFSIDFIKELNKQAAELDTWSFDAAFKNIFGEHYGINEAWTAYQNHLAVDLGITQPYPGYSNFAVSEGVSVTIDGSDLSPYGLGLPNLTDENFESAFIGVIEQPAWWHDSLPATIEVDNVTITFEIPEATVMHKYAITVGNDHLKWNPTGWTLEGATEDGDWVVLDTNAYPEENNKLDTFIFDINNNSTAYSAYRFTFENTRTGEGIGGDNGLLVQIGEVALLTEE